MAGSRAGAELLCGRECREAVAVLRNELLVMRLGTRQRSHRIAEADRIDRDVIEAFAVHARGNSGLGVLDGDDESLFQ